MASQYDSIQTPKDLITRVSIQGFSTKIDDRLRAQDIFGRAAIEDLVELANAGGKISENFYMVLFSIWHWSDATRFYNEHSNPGRDRLVNAESKIRELETEVKMAKLEADEHHEDCQEFIRRLDAEKAAHAETCKETEFYKAGYEAAKQEIIRLKAKLYDRMIEKEEK